MMMVEQNKIWIEANWPAPEYVHAGTSIRTNGVSKTKYASLNLAAHVGDNEDDVKENRFIFSESMNLPGEPAWLTQVHGNDIITLAGDVPATPTADGSMTTTSNRVCAVLTADCVPLLFCNEAGTQVAAVHAGWRGICKGIIDRAASMYSDPDRLLVWIGPCIHKDAYEVGHDVFAAATRYAENADTAFVQTDASHWHCDLVQLVTTCLHNSGVNRIFDSGLCTHVNAELFYSYRRDGETGRTASLIWME